MGATDKLKFCINFNQLMMLALHYSLNKIKLIQTDTFNQFYNKSPTKSSVLSTGKHFSNPHLAIVFQNFNKVFILQAKKTSKITLKHVYLTHYFYHILVIDFFSNLCFHALISGFIINKPPTFPQFKPPFINKSWFWFLVLLFTK